MSPFIIRDMNETKQCSKCKVFWSPKQIEEGNNTCNICLEQKRRYRLKHKEEIKVKAKEYYEEHKEKLNEKQRVKAECPVCKCMVRAYAMRRHEQSVKHQMNLNGHYLIWFLHNILIKNIMKQSRMELSKEKFWPRSKGRRLVEKNREILMRVKVLTILTPRPVREITWKVEQKFLWKK